MLKTEVYANRSVEENLLAEIEGKIPGIAYSFFENVQGRGRSGIRRGTAIWPELNVLYVFFGSRADAALILDAVKSVKKEYPQEGIKIYQYEIRALHEAPISLN